MAGSIQPRRVTLDPFEEVREPDIFTVTSPVLKLRALAMQKCDRDLSGIKGYGHENATAVSHDASFLTHRLLAEAFDHSTTTHCSVAGFPRSPRPNSHQAGSVDPRTRSIRDLRMRSRTNEPF